MDIEVNKKFSSYPDFVRDKLVVLRELILEVVREENLGELTETLKWGEPGYSVKNGSALRIDWKPKLPESYSMYFNCNTKLIETFREIYPDVFQYEGKREIRFDVSKPLAKDELKVCISMCLRYHKIKHLPLLGF